MEPPTHFPPLLEHVWSAFIALSSTRGSAYAGPNPISYEQIKAYKELTDTSLTGWEVETIMRLDRVYMGVANG